MENENNKKDIERTGIVKSCFEWVDSLIPALIVMVILFTFVLRSFVVVGVSMENTLHNGERLIGRSLFYKPKNGDIVAVGPIYNLNDHIIIKRVIATEGQTLDINFDTGEVKVDGRVLDEPYIKNLTTTDDEGGEIPKVIPAGKVFVMGDNRKNSTDSRSPLVGLVSVDQILGEAVLRYFPLDRIGML